MSKGAGKFRVVVSATMMGGGWTSASPVGLIVGVVVLLHVVICNSGDVTGVGSFNRYYNDVVEKDDLRDVISRQLPKQGKFFEEFDRSKYER